MGCSRGNNHRRDGSSVRFLLFCFLLAVGYQVLLALRTWGTAVPSGYPLDDPAPVLLPQCSAFIPKLTEEIRHDPIGKGLRPVRVQMDPAFATRGNKTTLIVKGMTRELFPSAFRGHRIALLGDSTLYYLTKWVYSMFHHNKTRAPFLPSNDATYNLTQASKSVADYAQQMCEEGKSASEPCVQPYDHQRPLPVVDAVQNLYYMEWAGMSGIRDNWQTEKFLSAMWEKTAQVIRPDVMVVNMGLHWLHLYGIIRDTGPQAIVRWLQYETWLQEVLDHAKELGVKVLLYKTANFVCDRKMTNGYAKGVKLYGALDPTTLSTCADKVQKAFVNESAGVNITDHQIADYCANGTLSFHGSTLLNRRLERFLNGLGESPPGMYVGLFNDHDIQNCGHTAKGDGLHYHSLNLVRIRLLANYLQCATAEARTSG